MVRAGRNRGLGSCARATVTNDSVFRHSERYSGSDEKELGYYLHVSPLGVVAQFAWQLFVKGLLRGNVIDGGRALRHRVRGILHSRSRECDRRKARGRGRREWRRENADLIRTRKVSGRN